MNQKPRSKWPRKRKTAKGHVWEDMVWFRDEHGKRYQRWCYGATKAEVLTSKAQLLKERASQPGRSRRKETLKVADIAEQFAKDHMPKLVPSTRAYYRAAMVKRIAPYLFEVQADKVTRRQVSRWMTTLLEAGHSPRTTNAALSTLKAVYGRANDWELFGPGVVINPCAGVKRIPEATRVPKIYSPDQVQQVAQAARSARLSDKYNPQRAEWLAVRDEAMVMLLALTGLRIGELLALQWQDVERSGERQPSIHVNRVVVAATGEIRPYTKSKKDRQVPALPTVCRLFDEWLKVNPGVERSSLVFPQASGGPIDQGNWRSRTFKPAAAAVGFPEALPHDLRHTFATWMIERSRGRVTPKVLQAWMGHAHVMTTLGTYGHVWDRIEDSVLSEVDEALFVT